MSRIGKQPIAIPAGVTLSQEGQTVTVKGAKGSLSFALPASIFGEQKDGEYVITPLTERKGDEEYISKQSRSLWGLSRSLIANLIEGVSEGFSKALELRGVGYRAQMKGSALTLQLGYSHEIDYTPPEGIVIVTPKPTEVIVSGIDKQKVGQVAAEIRAFRKPEPYKGKGVRYVGEYVRIKEGKKK